MGTDNFTFLVYGLIAAWLILFAYVAALAGRGRRIERELENLKQMLKEPAEKQDRTVRPPEDPPSPPAR
jgi:CcmD family protein